MVEGAEYLEVLTADLEALTVRVSVTEGDLWHVARHDVVRTRAEQGPVLWAFVTLASGAECPVTLLQDAIVRRLAVEHLGKAADGQIPLVSADLAGRAGSC